MSKLEKYVELRETLRHVSGILSYFRNGYYMLTHAVDGVTLKIDMSCVAPEILGKAHMTLKKALAEKIQEIEKRAQELLKKELEEARLAAQREVREILAENPELVE